MPNVVMLTALLRTWTKCLYVQQQTIMCALDVGMNGIDVSRVSLSVVLGVGVRSGNRGNRQ